MRADEFDAEYVDLADDNQLKFTLRHLNIKDKYMYIIRDY